MNTDVITKLYLVTELADGCQYPATCPHSGILFRTEKKVGKSHEMTDTCQPITMQLSYQPCL